MVSKIAIGVVALIVIAGVVAAVVLTLPPSNTSSGGSGKLAVAGTDPPVSSDGTTQEYEHYNNVAAHKSQPSSSTTSTATSASASGWVMLNASGTLDLNALVNASQTMALANVSAGTYNAIRLYVDSAIVTYQGQNYTARMSSGQLTASLEGNAQVSGSSTTVVIFDLRTVIINAGGSSSPQFVVTSSARAEAAPSGSYTSASLKVGTRVDLSSSSWFKTFVQGNARLQITSASISSSSLSVTVKDTGSETANATLVIVTPVSASVSSQATIPGSLQGSAVFVVGPSGAMQASTSLLAQVTSPGAGASVTSSSSTTLTYSGSIQFGLGAGALGVTSGQSYVITVVGTNTVASTTVTAS